MSLVKITFDGSSVSSKQDADINYHLTGLVPAGIIRGLGSELSVSASNNYITFQSGYVQIYGRRIFVEAGSQVYISLDATRYGYVVINVNLTNGSVIMQIVEGSSGYPTLTQQNLATGGTTYQMPIARYTKTATSLTLDTSFARTYIETPLSVARSGYNDAVNYMSTNYKYYQKYAVQSGNKSTFYLTSDQASTKVNTLFFAKISTGHIVAFPGGSISGLSSFLVSYCDGGTNCSVIVSYSPGGSYIATTCSNTSHYINYIYAVR